MIEFGEDGDKWVDFIFEVELLFKVDLIHSGLFLHEGLIAEVLDHFVSEFLLHPLEGLASFELVIIALFFFDIVVVVV